MAEAIETIDGTTWLLIIAFIIAFVGNLLLVMLPSMGVNVKERFSKFMKKQDDVMDEKTSYRLIRTNEDNPPLVVDPETGREEFISAFSVENENSVALFANDDEGKLRLFTEIEDRRMIQPKDPLYALKETAGLRFVINRKSTDMKLKREMESWITKASILENELKAMREQTTKQHIVSTGEAMKEVRKAAYGSNRSQFGDRFGFGSSYKKPFSGLGGEDEGGEE